MTFTLAEGVVEGLVTSRPLDPTLVMPQLSTSLIKPQHHAPLGIKTPRTPPILPQSAFSLQFWNGESRQRVQDLSDAHCPAEGRQIFQGFCRLERSKGYSHLPICRRPIDGPVKGSLSTPFLLARILPLRVDRTRRKLRPRLYEGPDSAVIKPMSSWLKWR